MLNLVQEPANGVGKSTLINILTNPVIKDNGKVEWTPKVQPQLNQHSLAKKELFAMS